MSTSLEEFLLIQMENMKLLNEQLRNLQNEKNTSVPWPKPLQVETGDLRQNFELFKSNWKEYEFATGMDKWGSERESQKVNILLSVIGDTAKVKYHNFCLTDEDKSSTEKVLKKINDQLVDQEHPLYERWIFHNCNQLENEDFNTYLIRLTKIADNCQFEQIPTGKIKETLIRDRLVFGITDSNLKKRFLKEKPDKLSLTEIIEQCKVHEITEDRFKQIVNEDKNINKVMRKEFKEHGLKQCKFCGKRHVFEKDVCPARNQQCNFCKVKGHFEKCCFRKLKRMKRHEKKVKELKEESTDSDEEEKEEIQCISKVTDDTRYGGSVRAELNLKFNEWKTVSCELDTGASVCLMGYQYLLDQFNGKIPELKESKYKLKGFGGQLISVKGEIYIRCQHKNKNYNILFQIVEIDHGPLLSATACVSLGLVKYCNKVVVNKDDGILEARKIIQEYEDVFKGQGVLEGEVDLEIDKSIKPVIQTARRIPINLRKDLLKELRRLEDKGIIQKEEHHTEWVSNLLLVKKTDSFRICLDPIPLNRALKRPNYQFNTIDEILPELGKAKVFTTVDTKKGFWHIKLTEESSKLTSFWTPYGRYRWLRLPFGVAPAPEIFAMKIYEVLHGLVGIEVMADDILVYGCGDTMEEALVDHNRNLKNLFIRLREKNIKLNKSKLNLCQREVKFYGHVLSEEGLKPDMTKISAIINMPKPNNKTDLHRFLGMITYLGRYIKNLSCKTTNLRKLLLERAVWKWEEDEMEEFSNLKQTIGDLETLSYFRPNEPVMLDCDASSEGLGAVLYQKNGIVAYASRVLTSSERNYAMIEKELLGIVFACTRFDKYIVGNSNVTVRTDHRPLLPIFKKPLLKAPKRLQAMLMVLQRYNVKLEFISGKDNIIADTLSRASVSENSREILKPEGHIYCISKKEQDSFKWIASINTIEGLTITDERLDSIREETNVDTSLRKLIQLITYGWPKYIRDVPDDIKIYYKYKNDLAVNRGLITKSDRVLIPQSLRRTIINKIHVSHMGIENTLKLAKQNVFWPGMCTDIKEKIQSCDICLKHNNNQQKLPMMSSPLPTYPWQIISMDVCFVEYKEKQRKVLVVVDHYSDYFEMVFLKNLTPGSIISNLKEMCSRFGIPELLISDNGTNFVNQEMYRFCEELKIRHVTSSPHHQQTNGKAEATVKIIKNLIKKCQESKQELWYVLLHWRNTPNKMDTSPVQRFLCKQTRHGLPSVNLKQQMVPNVLEKKEDLHRQSKYYYDKKTRDLPELKIGDKVRVQLKPQLNTQWSTGIINGKLSERSYMVDSDGKCYQRDRVHIREDKDKNDIPSPPSNEIQTREHENRRLNQDYGKERKEDAEQETTTRELEEVLQGEEEKRVQEDKTKVSETRPKRERKTPGKFKDYHLF